MRGSNCSQLLRLAAAATFGSAAAAQQSAVHQKSSLQAAAAAAQHALWSAAVGNRQLPWHLCTLAGRQHTFSTDADSASSTASQQQQLLQQLEEQVPQQQQQSEQRQLEQQQLEQTQQREQQQQHHQLVQEEQQQQPGEQQQAVLNFTDSLQPQAGAAAAAAAANLDLTLQVAKQKLQQQQQQQLGQQDGGIFKFPPGLPLDNVTDVNSDSFKQLLPYICSVVVNVTLKPLQLDTKPRLSTLDEQERMALRGQKGFRAHDDAFACMNQFLALFSRSQAVRESARGAHIPKNLIPQATASFRRYIQRAVTPGLLTALLAAGIQPASSSSGGGGGSGDEAVLVPSYTPEVEGILLPLFLEYCQQHYMQEIAAYAAAVATLDLRSPHTWYPYARAIKRKIIYHGGPTNSGKTYNALQSLAAAERGIYCAPLRLLAMEVYETLNHRGVYCDLVTGQEVMHVPGSGHVSCTVEMANINAHFDVAVIDEIQLIGDQQRGFAWSRALLGLPANTIHVCGDTSALALIRHLAGLCGDDFEVHSYERMTPLQLDPTGLPKGYADVQPGDAVVAFSRRNIYKARRAIEDATGQKTCIVYGALPAETRRHQARLFNNPASGVNVLIASDAIGLGLNFNIRRVIFTSLTKHSRGGTGTVKVPVSLIKQIAGRAGRRNSIYPEGCVTTLDPLDMPYLRKALEAPASSLYTPAAGLAPEYETVELLSAQFPTLSLEELLTKLDSEARLDGRYFMCKQEQLLETARVLRWVKGLTLQDQFTLVNAPIDVYDAIQRGAFIDFARAYAAGQPVVFNEALMPKGPPRTEGQMEEAEDLHKIMGCWLWLSYRFENGSFPGRERVQALARQLCDWLNTGLANIQTPEELLLASTTAAPAAAGAAVPGSSTDSSTNTSIAAAAAAGSPESAEAVTETASAAVAAEAGVDTAAAAAAGADSSDVDEYSDRAFTLHVEEAPLDAADRGYDGEVVTPSTTAAAAAIDIPGSSVSDTNSSSSSSSSNSTGSRLQDSSIKLTRKQLAALRKKQPPYIRWTAAVASGPAVAAYSDNLTSSSSNSSSSSSSLSMIDSLTGGGMEAIESLLMPDYEPSMAAFVRWRVRPRFQVPPPPEVVGQRRRSKSKVQ